MQLGSWFINSTKSVSEYTRDLSTPWKCVCVYICSGSHKSRVVSTHGQVGPREWNVTQSICLIPPPINTPSLEKEYTSNSVSARESVRVKVCARCGRTYFPSYEEGGSLLAWARTSCTCPKSSEGNSSLGSLLDPGSLSFSSVGSHPLPHTHT